MVNFIVSSYFQLTDHLTTLGEPPTASMCTSIRGVKKDHPNRRVCLRGEKATHHRRAVGGYFCREGAWMSLRVGAKVRLTIVRVTVTAAVLLFSVMDYALSVGFGLARAVRQHYRTFGASLAPGGATLLAAAPPPKPSVVVIGGSFAGLRVQRELSDNFDVTVVDLKEYFEYTPGVLRLYTQPEVRHTGSNPRLADPRQVHYSHV